MPCAPPFEPLLDAMSGVPPKRSLRQGPGSGCFARWGSRGAEGGAGESGAGQGAGEEGERVPKVTAVCTEASDALAGHLPGERAEGAGRFRLCWSQVALGDTGLPPRQHLGSGSGESQGVWEAPGADRKSAVGEERPKKNQNVRGTLSRPIGLNRGLFHAIQEKLEAEKNKKFCFKDLGIYQKLYLTII